MHFTWMLVMRGKENVCHYLFYPNFNVLLHQWICFWTNPLALQISLPARGWQSSRLCIYLPGARKWPSELLLFVGSAVCTGSVSFLFHVLISTKSSECFDFICFCTDFILVYFVFAGRGMWSASICYNWPLERESAWLQGKLFMRYRAVQGSTFS